MAKSGRADAVLIAALAAGATQESAAKQAGVGTRTVRDRLADPAFRAQVEQARSELVTTATARLSAAATEAVETLVGLLAAESESVRLGAAKGIIELGCRLREAGELEAKVRDLTDRLAQLEESRGPRVVTRPA